MQKTKAIFFHPLRFFRSLSQPERVILREKIYSYALSLLITGVTIVFALYMYRAVGRFNILPLFFLAITLSAWYGNVRTGILATALTTFTYIYYFFVFPLKSVNEFMSLIPAMIFLLTGILISYLLDKAKRTDEVTKYKLETLKAHQVVLLEKKKNAQAHEEIKARDEFLSIATHELKTPLTLSLLQIQRALHNIKNVSLANFSVQNLMSMLESIEHQTDRLSKLISDLSNVSLITTGRMRLEVDDVNITEVIKDVIKRVPLTMNKEGYPITFKENGDIKGRWDKIRIEQVLTNLVTNAIKYGNGKPIEVFLKTTNDWLSLYVKDRGLGIPKELQQKVFDRFERGAADKGIKGLGVGLYITKQIITAHGGTIELNSKPGRGSEFIVKLPRNNQMETKNISLQKSNNYSHQNK